MNNTKYTMIDESNKNTNRDYRTSVEAGLKRLEAQKLGFLGTGRVVSKFDAQNIETYSVAPHQSVAGMPPVDRTLEDLNGSDRVCTDLDISAGTSSASVEFGLGELNDDAKTTAFEPEEMSVLKDFDIDSLLGEDAGKPAATLELSSLRNSGERASGERASVARASVAHVLDPEGAPTVEAASVSRGGNAFDMMETIQAEAVSSLERLRASYDRGECRAQVLRPAQIQARDSLKDEHEQAIDRLKNRGLFEPVVHGEVLQSLRGIQAVDALIPPSEIKPYSAAEENEDETVDQSHDAVQALRAGAVTSGEDDGEDHTVEVGAVARAVAEQLESAKRLQAEDEKRLKDEEEKLRKAEAAMRKQGELARQRDAKRMNAADANPNIVPVVDQRNAEIESRETRPLDLSQQSLQELQQAFPVKRQADAPMNPADSILVVEEEGSSGMLALILVLVFLLICGIIWLLYESDVFSGFSKKLSPYQAPQIQEIVNGIDPQTLAQTRADIARVSQQFNTVLSDKVALQAWLDAKIEETADPLEYLPFVEFALSVFPDNAEYYQKLIEAYIDTRQFSTARAVLKNTPPEIRSLENIRALGYMVFAGDPEFISPAAAVTEELCDEIAPLGGGSTLTFKFKKNGKNIGAFKPLQNRKQSNYRAEIAAWRVCELLQCDFRVPWNRPVKVERNMFNKLYNRTTSSKREAYRKELVDLTWTREGDKYYVYGTLKDWVPDFTRFPIEKTSMWRPWLSQDKYIENDKYPPLREALRPLAGQQYTKKLYTELLSQSSDLTTEQLASQISQVLVFDYLIGNWDRFSGVPEWAGVNCQFKDNKIVSIDNGASFPAYSNEKVYERFMMTERFSLHMIDSLRALDKAQTFKLLFPDASKYETEAFEQFWKQRSALLTRIDSLSQTYGSKRVLSFE